MAAILGHAPSQLRPQSKMLRTLKGRPLDSARKTSLSAQPSRPLASLWCSLPQPPSHAPLPTPRPAQWFLRLCTPAIKMVSPCCLHSDIPPPPPQCTRALATPDHGNRESGPAPCSTVESPRPWPLFQTLLFPVLAGTRASCGICGIWNPAGQLRAFTSINRLAH